MKRHWLFCATVVAVFFFPLLLHAAEPTVDATPLNWVADSVLWEAIFSPASTLAMTCSASQACDDGSTLFCSCPGTGSCTASGFGVDCDCTPDPDYHYTCPPPPPTCPQEGASCVKNLDCGTCMGAACFCSNRRCICIA